MSRARHVPVLRKQGGVDGRIGKKQHTAAEKNVRFLPDKSLGRGTNSDEDNTDIGYH